MDRRTRPALGAATALIVALAACSQAAPASAPPTAESVPPSATEAAPTAPTPSAPPSPTPAAASAPPTSTTELETIPYRIERRTTDEATADFEETVQAVLTDERGWVRADLAFELDPNAPYVIVLAEADEVDALCLPMDTKGQYSCQNGPVVALNADRWRDATPQWPADLTSYRTMLINHEVGHLLHLHHPEPQCPGEGLPAPVMTQQSTTLQGCEPNPWPLQWEIELAAARLEPLAPPPEHVTWDHRPSPPPDRRG